MEFNFLEIKGDYMKSKIVLMSLIVLVLAIGAVSAAVITDYNSPSGFERSAATFTNDDFEMDMRSYSAFIDYEDYFVKNDNRDVKIINGTYAQYNDSVKDKVGALELLKIDDDVYIIDCSFDDADKNKTADCLKYIQEFNDLNKFKPIKIDKSS